MLKWLSVGPVFDGILRSRLHYSGTIPIIRKSAITNEMETLRNNFAVCKRSFVIADWQITEIVMEQCKRKI